VEFFTALPAPVGGPGGGMANAIVGSVKLLVLAAAIGIPLGFLAGLYTAEFAPPAVAVGLRYVADLLNGVPSIVIGIVAYSAVVLPMRQFSTLAGGVALGIMMVPVTARGTDEFLRAVPASLREASLALGAAKWMTIALVVVPAASRGIATAVTLGLARAAGEAAPLLFTALNNRFWSDGWTEPTASLPVMIFTYATSPYEEWIRQAWAAALVLLAVVLTANVAARLLARRRSIRRAEGSHERNRVTRCAARLPGTCRRHDCPPFGQDDLARSQPVLRREAGAAPGVADDCHQPRDCVDWTVGMRQVDVSADAEPDERHHTRHANVGQRDPGRR
jgi:phosphate transport system permease protein